MSNSSAPSLDIRPIGFVRNERVMPEDDNWDSVTSEIVLSADRVGLEATMGLDEFSHVEVIFYMDQVAEDKIETGARRPRNNPDWPRVGILSQRGKNRPNRLGVSRCALLKVSPDRLIVRGLDAIHSTPVLDIKPLMSGFLPRGEVREPAWSTELMKNYY